MPEHPQIREHLYLFTREHPWLDITRVYSRVLSFEVLDTDTSSLRISFAVPSPEQQQLCPIAFGLHLEERDGHRARVALTDSSRRVFPPPIDGQDQADRL